MAIGRSWWLAGAGLLGCLALVGCERQRGGEQAAQEEPGMAEQARTRAEEALEEAQRSQQQATGRQEESAQAQRDVLREQEELARAQEQARTAEQEALQAERQAQQQGQAARQQAEAAQQQGEMERRQIEAQAQAGARQAQQVVSGQLVEATEDEIRVGPATGNEVRLQVTEETRILVDGQIARLQDLQPGSQVRATYTLRQGEPVVTELEVTGADAGAAQWPSQQPSRQPAPAQPGTQQPAPTQPGAQQPARPQQPGGPQGVPAPGGP